MMSKLIITITNNQCKKCSKNFSHAGQLKGHILSVHETINGSKCDICGQKIHSQCTYKKCA